MIKMASFQQPRARAVQPEGDFSLFHIGGRILDHYCQTNGDVPPPELLSFYLAYRASVRAKVQAFMSPTARSRGRLADQPVRPYLQLADRYAAEIGPPLLLVVCGFTGVGKSTLAQVLSMRCTWNY